MVSVTGARAALSLLLATTLVACASPPAAAGGAPAPARRTLPSGVSLRHSLEQYPVVAPTANGALRQASLVGPMTAQGRFQGATVWSVRWTYEFERSTGSCTLRNVRADVTANVRVPRWDAPAGVDSMERLRWQRYRTRLDTHEAGHVDIAVQAGAEVVDGLRGLFSGDCETVRQRARTLGENVLARARARDLEFDRVTGHGFGPDSGAFRLGAP